MADQNNEDTKRASGYHTGSVESVMSVDAVAREAEKISEAGPSIAELEALANNAPYVSIDGLRAGYGRMEILHDFNLKVGQGQSLCLIGPNGAGKSTILHTIFGFTNIFAGTVSVGASGQQKNVTNLSSSQKLKTAGIAYILQDNSVFPDMTVEENLLMGGYLQDTPLLAMEKAEKVFQKYSRLAERRSKPARVLSGFVRRRAPTAGNQPGPDNGAGSPAGGRAFHRS